MFIKLCVTAIVFLFLFPAILMADYKPKDSEDPFIKGYTAYVLKDFTLAMNYWKPMAKNGFKDAQYLLGVMYANGQGTKIDFKQAAHWFLKSARQGDVGAMYFIATLLKTGTGVEKNLQQAGEWMQKAGEKDYPDAQLELGEMYASGKGRKRDLVQAYCWFQLAANNGIQSALTKNQQVATVLSKEDLRKAQERAYRLWKRFKNHEY